MDPQSKLLVVVDVGNRTLAMAQRVVHQVTQVLASACIPLFLTDGLKDYGTALLAHFGHWIQPARRQATGPMPQAALDAVARVLYAQVVNRTAPAHRGVKHRVMFGTRLTIEQVLAACGWTINTAFVERLNLDIRQRVAAIGRRVNTLCQGEGGLRAQLALFQTYHNFVLPHASLRHLASPRSHQRSWLSQAVAAVDTGNGGGLDRPRVDVERSLDVSGTTVAPATDGLRNGTA